GRRHRRRPSVRPGSPQPANRVDCEPGGADASCRPTTAPNSRSWRRARAGAGGFGRVRAGSGGFGRVRAGSGGASEAGGEDVALEPTGAAHDEPEGDDPDHGADRHGDEEVDEEQPGGLADGEDDERQDDGTAELVRLLGG